MVLSSTTNKNGIVQLCERLCKLGDGGITNDTTLFLQFTGDINQAYKKVSMALLRSDRRWKWDDSNYTDFAIGSINVVSGQRDLTLPAAVSGGNASTLYRINKVEILNGTTYQPINLMEIDEEEETTTGLPTKYKLVGNSIRFKELPNANITAGLRITFQRSVVEFTTSSTTEQPGFIDAYHDLLAYDASATYLMPINTQLAISYSNIFETRLMLLQKDKALMNDDVPRRLQGAKENNK
jgi:hypothetical protein